MEKNLILQEIEMNHFNLKLEPIKLLEAGMRDFYKYQLEKKPELYVHQNMLTVRKVYQESQEIQL
jgi:hypothetical protein